MFIRIRLLYQWNQLVFHAFHSPWWKWPTCVIFKVLFPHCGLSIVNLEGRSTWQEPTWSCRCVLTSNFFLLSKWWQLDILIEICFDYWNLCFYSKSWLNSDQTGNSEWVKCPDWILVYCWISPQKTLFSVPDNKTLIYSGSHAVKCTCTLNTQK